MINLQKGAKVALTITFLLTLSILVSASAQAQTLLVLHNFTDRSSDGGLPSSALAMGAGGVLYGTTMYGGAHNAGVVFQLKRAGSGWVLNPLHSFTMGSDGGYPSGNGVVIGSDGNLYGMTPSGGRNGLGVVYSLVPPTTACVSAVCPWNETTLYSFDSDASYAGGRVHFDQAGNIYGTTSRGGPSNFGTVWKLTPSGGGWALTILHSFEGTDGYSPTSGLISDSTGNLYGTTSGGGSGGCSCGTVYELTPSGSGWTEVVLYNFQNGPTDGAGVYAPVIFDQAGNLYGASSTYGSGGGGAAFELTPSGDNWIFNGIATFFGDEGYSSGPQDELTMDSAGNLYGTTVGSIYAHEYGSVFKLTNSNGIWTLTTLHAFTGGSDGAYPAGTVILDSNGNLFGTTQGGGTYGAGVVFEITPQ